MGFNNQYKYRITYVEQVQRTVEFESDLNPEQMRGTQAEDTVDPWYEEMEKRAAEPNPMKVRESNLRTLDTTVLKRDVLALDDISGDRICIDCMRPFRLHRGQCYFGG